MWRQRWIWPFPSCRFWCWGSQLGSSSGPGRQRLPRRCLQVVLERDQVALVTAGFSPPPASGTGTRTATWFGGRSGANQRQRLLPDGYRRKTVPNSIESGTE